jgi:hypothetical protein
MAAAALKLKPKLKTFHATILVTRVEEWCVEASCAEEARELLDSGAGYRCHLGECVHVDVESVETEYTFRALLFVALSTSAPRAPIRAAADKIVHLVRIF